MFYVYVDHTTFPERIPFYVGKGRRSRLNRIKRNNKHTWVRKHFGYERQVICYSSDPNLIKDIERELIAKLETFNPDVKDYTNIKCNLTIGGEGCEGFKISDAHKQRISNALKGKKKSQSHINHLTEARQSPELREIFARAGTIGGAAGKGRTLSADHKQHLKDAATRRRQFKSDFVVQQMESQEFDKDRVHPPLQA